MDTMWHSVDSRITSIEDKIDLLFRIESEKQYLKAAKDNGAYNAEFYNGSLFYNVSSEQTVKDNIFSALTKKAKSLGHNLVFSDIEFNYIAVDIT